MVTVCNRAPEVTKRSGKVETKRGKEFVSQLAGEGLESAAVRLRAKPGVLAASFASGFQQAELVVGKRAKIVSMEPPVCRRQ